MQRIAAAWPLTALTTDSTESTDHLQHW